MIKLEMELDELDYDAMLELMLPRLTEQLRSSGNPVGMLLTNGMPMGMAKKIVAGLSQDQKDKLLCDMLNANKARLISKAERFAQQNGVHGKVVDVRASRK